MKMNKIAAAICLAGFSSIALVGCLNDGNDKTGGSPAPVGDEFLAIDGYLQNAICCIDTAGAKSCADEATTGRTDNDGLCPVDPAIAGVRIAYADPAGGTTMSNQKGVPGSAAVPGVILTGPSGTPVVTAFTTLVQAQVELTGRSFDEVQAELVTQLGLSPGTDLTTFDYVAAASDANASVEAKRVKVIAETIMAAIAGNLTALQARGVAEGDSALQFATAVRLALDPDNSAGVKAADGRSLFEYIVDTVNDLPPDQLDDAVGADLYQSSVVDNADVTDIGSVESDDALEQLANDTAEQIEENTPPSPTGPTGNT